MDAIQEYALSIIATTLICSVVSNLLKNTAAKDIVRMICGMVLTLTVVAPLWKMDLNFDESLDSMFMDAANAASAEGEEISRETLQKIIKQKTEAYIQDKAAELNADITAEVTLSRGDPPIPESAVISGSITPYAKQKLQEILQTQLGIAKENLKWTG